MPFHFYHGPGANNFSSDLIKNYLNSDLINNTTDDYQVILPNSTLINWYERNILKFSSGFFSKDNLSDFNFFLKKILKLNLARFHLTSPRLERLIIRKILFEYEFSFLGKLKEYLGFIEKLRKTILSIKKLGFTEDEITHQLHSYSISFKEITQLIKLYNQELHQHYLLDEGDLYAKTLDLLKKKKLILPENLKLIILDQIFPLSISEREIIKLLINHFSELTIIVNYPYSFKREDSFQDGFEFLGNLADQSSYLPHTSLPQINYYQANNPIDEIYFTLNQITQLIEKNIPLSEIAVILPSQNNYLISFLTQLEEHQIPYQTTISYPYELLRNNFSSLNLLIHQNKNEFHFTYRDQLNQYSSYQEFKEEFLFDINFIHLEKLKSDQLIEWEKQEWQFEKIKLPKKSDGLFLTTLEEARSQNWQYTFLLGFNDQNYPGINNQSLLFQPEIWNHPELREVLEGPSYQQGLKENLFLQLIYSTTQLTLITPSQTIDGKTSNHSYFLDLAKDIIPISQIISQSQIKKLPILEQTKFSKKTKNTYSVTELETYQNCPYQYYQKYINRIKIEKDDPYQISNLTLGNLIHQILFNWIKKFSSSYQKLIHEKITMESLLNQLSDFIDEGIISYQEKINLPPFILKNYKTQIKRALQNYIYIEVNSIRENKKITYPQYFEWSFRENPLVIKKENKKLRITGQIDRIDLNQDQEVFSVIDYKTGNLPTNTSIQKGESLQIPIYLMAVEELLLPSYKPISGILIGLKELKSNRGIVFKKTSEEKLLNKASISYQGWEELKEKIIDQIFNLDQRIENQDFSPKPLNDQTCNPCDFKEICDYYLNKENEVN